MSIRQEMDYLLKFAWDLKKTRMVTGAKSDFVAGWMKARIEVGEKLEVALKKLEQEIKEASPEDKDNV